MPMLSIKSHKVRTILRLESRAERLGDRYEKAMERVAPARRQADLLLEQARALELTLTGGQLGELRRARAQAPEKGARDANGARDA